MGEFIWFQGYGYWQAVVHHDDSLARLVGLHQLGTSNDHGIFGVSHMGQHLLLRPSLPVRVCFEVQCLRSYHIKSNFGLLQDLTSSCIPIFRISPSELLLSTEEGQGRVAYEFHAQDEHGVEIKL